MNVVLRMATASDAPAIVTLVGQLAAHLRETSRVSEAVVKAFLAHPGCGGLLAESSGRAVGILTFLSYPDLYHSGVSAEIRELVVADDARGEGVGRRLVEGFLEHARAADWAEVSVSTMTDERGAAEFYRSCGFTDEALQLEYHLPAANRI